MDRGILVAVSARRGVTSPHLVESWAVAGTVGGYPESTERDFLKFSGTF